MNNPLVGGVPGTMGRIGNMQRTMQMFNQFRQSFHGDPRQQIQELMNSGKISQQAYNDAYQKAQQLQRMLGQ